MIDPNHAPTLEDDVLMRSLFKSIDAPEAYAIDDLIQGVDHLKMRYDNFLRMRSYVNVIIYNPLLSYRAIRKALEIFAQACNPPLTIEQARAYAFIEKLRRAQNKDPAAILSLCKHEKRLWNLPDSVEVTLWSWLSKAWPAHVKVALTSNDFKREIDQLSSQLEISGNSVLEWIRGTFAAMWKMHNGRVNTSGMTIDIVVRAAIDDTPP